MLAVLSYCVYTALNGHLRPSFAFGTASCTLRRMSPRAACRPCPRIHYISKPARESRRAQDEQCCNACGCISLCVGCTEWTPKPAFCGGTDSSIICRMSPRAACGVLSRRSLTVPVTAHIPPLRRDTVDAAAFRIGVPISLRGKTETEIRSGTSDSACRLR